MRFSYLILFLIAVAVSFIIMYFASKLITDPIKRLIDGVLKIESGDYKHKVGTNKKDEIGILSRAFDKMTSKILTTQREKVKILESVKINLEKKVKEKTASLQEAQNIILHALKDVQNEKNKIEQEKVKDEAIFKSIGEGLVVLDSEGKISFINKKAQKILKRGDIETIGVVWQNVLILDGEDRVCNNNNIQESCFEEMFINVSEHKIFHFIRKDGSKFPAIVAATSIILNKKNIGAVMVFRDVTQEMLVDKAKSEFVSLASHQLRTPLSSIN